MPWRRMIEMIPLSLSLFLQELWEMEWSGAGGARQEVTVRWISAVEPDAEGSWGLPRSVVRGQLVRQA